MIKFYFGENSFEAFVAYKKAKAKYLKANKEAELIEITDFNFDKSKLGVFQSFGMFSSKKLVVFKNIFGLKAADQQKVVEALEGKNEEVEVLILEPGKADKRTKLYKFLQKASENREYKNKKGRVLERWVEAMAKKMGVNSKLVPKLTEAIVLRYADDQWRIYNELKKVSYFLKTKPDASFDEILEVLSSQSQVDIWKFIDDLFSRKVKKSVEFVDLYFVLEEDPFLLLGAIYSQLRILYYLKLFEGRRLDKVTEMLKIHPFRIKKSRNFINLFSLGKIEKLLNALERIDYSLKTGRGRASVAFKLLVCSF